MCLIHLIIKKNMFDIHLIVRKSLILTTCTSGLLWKIKNKIKKKYSKFQQHIHYLLEV
jgi:hypothetical protein